MIVADKIAFFKHMSDQFVALTFGDVLIKPARSHVPVSQVDINSRFSRHVTLKIPMVSAAMDTVTESKMAIAMAKLGGLGVIHAGLTIEQQKKEVRRVKLFLNGLIERPICVRTDRSVQSVLQECEHRELDFRTFPVVDANERLVGILTQNDIDFCEDLAVFVSQAMTPLSDTISAPRGTGIQEAYRIMIAAKKKTLPLVNPDNTVIGLYVFSDVVRLTSGNAAQYNIDPMGRLRVAAAVPTDNEALDRVREMIEYLDVAVIDTAQGDSDYSFQTLEALKSAFPHLDVVVGNVSVGTSAKELAEAGADGIKIGQGAGAICTTRIETGMGYPQLTAVYECAQAVEPYTIPICADGGIAKRGDISIAIAAGAHNVMMGRMLAGTDESPGHIFIRPDGSRMVEYRGMGSASAISQSAAAHKRYGGTAEYTPLPEGVESEIPYQGSINTVLTDLTKALRKSMSYVGSTNIQQHRENTTLTRITNNGVKESNPHDVQIIQHIQKP